MVWYCIVEPWYPVFASIGLCARMSRPLYECLQTVAQGQDLTAYCDVLIAQCVMVARLLTTPPGGPSRAWLLAALPNAEAVRVEHVFV